MRIEEFRELVAERFNARTAAGAAAAIVILTAIILLLLHYRRPTIVQPTGRYFINEITGELSVQPMNAIPPLPDSTGKLSLVYAVLYSRDGGATKTPAYYEKYTPDVVRIMKSNATGGVKSAPPAGATSLYGLLVRLPAKGSPWVAADSHAGMKIMASLPTGPGITQCSLVLP